MQVLNTLNLFTSQLNQTCLQQVSWLEGKTKLSWNKFNVQILRLDISIESKFKFKTKARNLNQNYPNLLKSTVEHPVDQSSCKWHQSSWINLVLSLVSEFLSEPRKSFLTYYRVSKKNSPKVDVAYSDQLSTAYVSVCLVWRNIPIQGYCIYH